MQIIQTRVNIIRKTVSELGAGLHSALWIQHSSVRPVLEARDKGMKWFWNVCGINVEVEERMQLLKIICFKIRPPWEDIFWDYHRCDNPYVIIHRYHLGELKMKRWLGELKIFNSPNLKTSPQAKRHKPSLLITFLTVLTSLASIII